MCRDLSVVQSSQGKSLRVIRVLNKDVMAAGIPSISWIVASAILGREHWGGDGLLVEEAGPLLDSGG